MAGVYNMFIFNTCGACLYYHEFSQCATSSHSADELRSLIYGFLCQMKLFTARISPTELQDNCTFSYATSKYKFHCYEAPTGVKFIVNTEPNSPSLCDFIKQEIYYKTYQRTVVRNGAEDAPVEPIESPEFTRLLTEQFDSKVNLLRVAMKT